MNTIYVAGDSHAEFHKLRQWASSVEDSVLLHVGDLGYGRDCLYKIGQLSKILRKNNNKVFVARGNHDDVNWFIHNGTENNSILLLEDNTVIEVGTKRILFLGGGISLDRSKRIPRVEYWEEEGFVFDPSILNYRGLDMVVSHIAPLYYTNIVPPDNSPFVQGWAKDDPELIKDLKEEQKAIQEAFQGLLKNNPLTHIYFGHFHEPFYFWADNSKKEECFIRGLAINEIVENV